MRFVSSTADGMLHRRFPKRAWCPGTKGECRTQRRAWPRQLWRSISRRPKLFGDTENQGQARRVAPLWEWVGRSTSWTKRLAMSRKKAPVFRRRTCAAVRWQAGYTIEDLNKSSPRWPKMRKRRWFYGDDRRRRVLDRNQYRPLATSFPPGTLAR